MSGGISMQYGQQTSQCVLAPLSSWMMTTGSMVVGKCGLLVQTCSLKDADNEWVNNLTFPRSPTHAA